MGGPGSGRHGGKIAPATVGGRMAIQAMDRLGLYPSAVAAECGIDRSRFRRLLTGEGTPSLREAVAIERLLDVPCEWWLKNNPHHSEP